MAVPSPSKERLRTEALLARRNYARSLSSDTRESLEQALAMRALPHLLTARVIAGYHPMRDEISPYPLLTRLGHGQRIALPWFANRDSHMMFHEGDAVDPGPWGMLQPTAAAPALAPDMVLVPLVLADRLGTRIGHGKGHYDRALAHLRDGGIVFTIGFAWEMQIADEPLSADPWDMALDSIATPAEWIDCRANREAAKDPERR